MVRIEEGVLSADGADYAESESVKSASSADSDAATIRSLSREYGSALPRRRYVGRCEKINHCSATVPAEIASDNVPSPSARDTAPISLYSVSVLTTGTLRNSLASSTGNTSDRC